MTPVLVALALTLGAEPAPTAPAEVAAPPVTVSARLVAADGQPVTSLKLSTPEVLEITATAPQGATVFGPFRPALGSFEVIEPRPGSVKPDGDKRVETWRFLVLPLRLGVEKVPAIEIPDRLADGTQGVVSTPILRVRVQGFLDNEQDPAPGAAPAPVDVIARNWALIWALSIGGALVLAALVTLFVLKALDARFRALAPTPPPRPANEVALERLDALDRTPAAELDGAQRLAATIDVLRGYLQGRYQIDAPEMTTRELMAALDGVDLKGVSKLEVGQLLEDTDLVKFARIVPKEDEARAVSPVVRKIVVDTWEPPKVEVEEIVRLEPASLRQRVYAAGVDVGLGLALSGLFVGLLLVTGAGLAWAGLVIPIVGLVLALRDAGGRSLGKALLGTSVVERSKRQPPSSARQRMKRNALLFVWPLTLPLEALVLRKHPLGLRLGDLWADTEIVRGGRR
ncbi:MAG: RDD family protein [Deltaproteobacteria bacterium]|nr:RDD family protein [Deltaproteobacteria bacterium]